MKTHNVEQKSIAWHELRRGKVTGTGLKKIIGTPLARQSYFMEVLAERLSIDGAVEESALERGIRLEYEALEKFERWSGKIVTQIGFGEREDNPNIAFSPDGLIENEGRFTEAVEIKCPASATFIQAWIENKVPKEYYAQAIQYFIVNDDLEKLYFVLYDNRITAHPLHVIELTREQVQKDITDYRAKEEKFIQEVEDKLKELVEF